jgi:asparagine synthase (glutamine-hydrolysing)
LQRVFEVAVVKRMMSDVPYGVLLSGGLDSSLVASVAARHAARRIEEQEKKDAWWPRLHSFCIGLEGSPDAAKAAEVAEFLGTVHHNFKFTVAEGLDAISDVIYHIESYDVTTVRASVPMYLLARRIKAMGVKMVLSGEGSDEVFGGYLYFYKAPNREEFHQETVRKLDALHLYDCLRANKAMSAWGVEVRVPFLDKAFLDVAMSMDPQLKLPSSREGRMEKHILRGAFSHVERPWLPETILWRQKEQFSDGVGYSWIDSLKKNAERQVTNAMFAQRAERFPFNPPLSKEEYFNRTIFELHFPEEAAGRTVPSGPSVACSSATAAAWDKAWLGKEDPSGRSVAQHIASHAEGGPTATPHPRPPQK